MVLYLSDIMEHLNDFSRQRDKVAHDILMCEMESILTLFIEPTLRNTWFCNIAKLVALI